MNVLNSIKNMFDINPVFILKYSHILPHFLVGYPQWCHGYCGCSVPGWKHHVQPIPCQVWKGSGMYYSICQSLVFSKYYMFILSWSSFIVRYSSIYIFLSLGSLLQTQNHTHQCKWSANRCPNEIGRWGWSLFRVWMWEERISPLWSHGNPHGQSQYQSLCFSRCIGFEHLLLPCIGFSPSPVRLGHGCHIVSFSLTLPMR